MSYHKTVEQYLEYCKFRKELDWNTLKAYRIDLKQFFEYVREDIPDKAAVEAYITELHKKYKPKTIKRKIASVRTYYSYLEEIEKLLNYMYINENRKSEKAYKFWLRDVAMIEIFFATGARVYEISNIKAECVNLNSGLIKIMGKGGKERYIQVVTPEILEILKKYYMYNCKEIKKSGFFFINSRGTRYYPIRIYVT